MNQINSDPDTKESNSKKFGKRIFDFIKQLELFVVLVIMGVSLIILFGVFSDSKALQITRLLPYLTATLLLLGLYIAFTTRTVDASTGDKIQQVIKRFMDIVLAFLMLNLLSPLFLLLSAALRIESPGPIFFYTIRVGQFGSPIRMLRFRTMYLAPKGGVTRIGNLLRQTHMNELPQLWNVLVGEMSLVGPSPRRPDHLEETLDSERKILMARPGITGLSQISGTSEKNIIDLDLQYVQKWSLALDIKILFKTFLIAFQDRKSA